MTTATVARPTTTAEVAEVMRDAAARGLTVVPCGHRTKLAWGLPPTSCDVLLDLSALDSVVDHAAGDLVVAAQAGLALARLQETLAEAGQRLAVDETVPGATVGGTLATNASGPLRLLAGTVRDLLIGVTVVRADGVVAKAGGRVVKNVAGYDLGKLMVGSYGTLAVVTEAIFRLHPVPAVRRWVSAAYDGPPDAQAFTRAVLYSQCVPSAVEVDDGTLTVLVEGRPAGVADRVATVRAVLGRAAVEDDRPPAGWGRYPWTEGEIAVKLAFRLSGLSEVLAGLPPAARVRGSAGAGVLYAALPADATEAVASLRETCTRLGGSLVVLDAPGEARAAVDVWGPVPALDLMRRVKDQFDPDHRLSPGRFVGGI